MVRPLARRRLRRGRPERLPGPHGGPPRVGGEQEGRQGQGRPPLHGPGVRMVWYGVWSMYFSLCLLETGATVDLWIFTCFVCLFCASVYGSEGRVLAWSTLTVFFTLLAGWCVRVGGCGCVPFLAIVLSQNVGNRRLYFVFRFVNDGFYLCNFFVLSPPPPWARRHRPPVGSCRLRGGDRQKCRGFSSALGRCACSPKKKK